jgi:hypothetical protein
MRKTLQGFFFDETEGLEGKAFFIGKKAEREWTDQLCHTRLIINFLFTVLSIIILAHLKRHCLKMVFINILRFLADS